ncbi:hypothetical protein [Arcanobacterium canis]
MGSRIRFVSTLMVTALVFVVVMLVMGVRLDIHTINPQPPSAQEISRQELALRVHALTKTSISNEAAVWEKALGGVWRAWPEGHAPHGHANPSPHYVRGSDHELLTDIVKRGASFQADRELGMSIAFAASARLHQQHALPDVGALARLADSPEAVRDIETAREWFEVWAARTRGSGDEEKRALISTLNGIIHEALASGVQDTRPTYQSISHDIPQAAYDLLYSRMLRMAHHADVKETDALLALGSQMQAIPGAPDLGPLPGLEKY